MKSFHVIIIGAGAAGLMCAIEAGKRGRRVCVLDHAKNPGVKIRISGGGRCNFTNLNASPETYLSTNKHFCKSALSRYTPKDFIALIQKHKIHYHEKKLGQLFCDDTSQKIVDMLLQECLEANVLVRMTTTINQVEKISSGYLIKTNQGDYSCDSLVIATGGLSLPDMGATNFGYKIAEQFGLNVLPPRAGLVPLVFQQEILKRCQLLSGLSLDVVVTCGKKSFSEAMLFTHRGLSGPVILQISSYWKEGEPIIINLAPEVVVLSLLKDRKQQSPKQTVQTLLSEILPKRLAQNICEEEAIQGKLADVSNQKLETLADAVNHWRIKPSGTEGYRTAEVTLGGVDTRLLSSKTMEAHNCPGLYFIGEVVDVAGHLGGYNLQWAWSSGYVAGQVV